MLIFTLPLCWMLSVESMSIHLNFTLRNTIPAIPLSMAEDSVDDMYWGCNHKMMKAVEHKYSVELQKEPYKKTWKECADKVLKEKKKHGALTKNHMQAICVYTSNKVYKDFNDAVRTQGSVYTSSFQFHVLHFFLTSAVQILNKNHHCHITYRRTKIMFTGKVNQRIRFGSFSSSSYRKDLHAFGRESCFKIKTCSGASLKGYSEYEAEAEVLIPPYEFFRISHILDGPSVRKIPGLHDCRKVFILKSAGTLSKLNCKIV